MKYLLAIFIALMIVLDTFSIEASIGLGLSVKNLLIYLSFAALLLQLAGNGESFKALASPVIWVFGLIIVYALCTLIVAGYLIDYNRYDLLQAVIRLKSDLIEPLLIFLVFLYGPTRLQDALWVVKALLLAAFFAHFATVLDAVFGFGWMKVGTDGRIQGALGEQNQYAAYIVTFLPAFIAAGLSASSYRRAFWALGLLLSMAALLMTVSRGAFLATLVMSAATFFMFRDIVPPARMLKWALMSVFMVALIVALVWVGYGDLLQERVLDQTFSAGAGDASSGRTATWMDVLTKMMDAPLSLVTGYGWYVYPTMGFLWITHNHYLDLWFNLGLVGLAGFIFILGFASVSARQAALNSSGEIQRHLMAFSVSIIGLAISIFFVNLFTPWPFIWAYFGVSLKLACLAVERETVPQRVVVSGLADVRRKSAGGFL